MAIDAANKGKENIVPSEYEVGSNPITELYVK